MKRQQEAEAAARAARRDIARLTPSPVPPSSATSSSLRMPDPEPHTRYAGRAVHAPQPSRPSESFGSNGLMPLESPTKYEDDSSTDVEGPKVPWNRRPADQTPKGKQTPGYVPACACLITQFSHGLQDCLSCSGDHDVAATTRAREHQISFTHVATPTQAGLRALTAIHVRTQFSFPSA